MRDYAERQRKGYFTKQRNSLFKIKITEKKQPEKEKNYWKKKQFFHRVNTIRYCNKPLVACNKQATKSEQNQNKTS